MLVGIRGAFVHALLVGTEHRLSKKSTQRAKSHRRFSRAVDRLVDYSEQGVAARIREDLSLLTDTLQARCAELPRLLEATQKPGRPRAWS